MTPIFVVHILLGVGPLTGTWLTTRSHTLKENWLSLQKPPIIKTPQLGVRVHSMLQYWSSWSYVVLVKETISAVSLWMLWSSHALKILFCSGLPQTWGRGLKIFLPTLQKWSLGVGGWHNPFVNEHIFCTLKSCEFLCKPLSTGQRNVSNKGCILQ